MKRHFKTPRNTKQNLRLSMLFEFSFYAALLFLFEHSADNLPNFGIETLNVQFLTTVFSTSLIQMC